MTKLNQADKLWLAGRLKEQIEVNWRCGYCGFKQQEQFSKCPNCSYPDKKLMLQNDDGSFIRQSFAWCQSGALSSPPHPVTGREWLWIIREVEKQLGKDNRKFVDNGGLTQETWSQEAEYFWSVSFSRDESKLATTLQKVLENYEKYLQSSN